MNVELKDKEIDAIIIERSNNLNKKIKELFKTEFADSDDMISVIDVHVIAVSLTSIICSFCKVYIGGEIAEEIQKLLIDEFYRKLKP
jgi:hypothetical protein